MAKEIAIILAGCGAADGSEIHESVMTLLAIDQQGASYQCFAPDIAQHHVINHINGEEMPETRNVLIESARICRGNIKPLNDYKAADYDALIFPGGFGAAKNLFTLALDGENFSIIESIEKAIIETHKAKKPIGALCISPLMLAKLIKNVKITLGQDADTIKIAENLGAIHKTSNHGEIIVDKTNKIVTTPCYMLEASLKDIAKGASNLVEAILTL